MSCKYCNGDGLGYGDKMLPLTVLNVHGKGKLILLMEDGTTVCTNVTNCPMCGRRIGSAEQDNNFNHSIKIPVPIGEKVWTFWTDCCCACHTEEKRSEEIQCSMFAPCHTFVNNVQPVVLKYQNIGNVLDGWGTKYFFTEQEARDAANKLVEKHRKRMIELGYELDENGMIKDYKRKIEEFYNADE